MTGVLKLVSVGGLVRFAFWFVGSGSLHLVF